MAGVALCVALGFGVVSPAIPLLAREFGVGATAAGAVVSAFALLRLVSGLFAGKLVDKLGERSGLAVGVGVVAVSSLLAGLAQSYPQLLVLRGIGGVGSAVFGVAAVGLVLRVAGRRMRAQAMSVYRSGFLVGGIIGPAVGGAVLGISLRAPFYLYAGTLVLAGSAALLFVSRRAAPDDPDGDTQQSQDGPSQNGPPAKEHEPTLRSVLHTAEYQAALAANLAIGISVFGLRNAAVPLLFTERIGAAPGWVGIAFLVSALTEVVFMFPVGRWADTRGRRPALVTGSCIAAIGLILLGLSGNLVLGLVAMGVFGTGAAFLGSIPGALVGDVAGKRSGTLVAVFNMASDLGAVTGPVLGGLLVDQGSFLGAFGIGAVTMVLAGLFGLRIRNQPAAA